MTGLLRRGALTQREKLVTPLRRRGEVVHQLSEALGQ